MKVGVLLPNAGPKASAEHIAQVARHAEALGFHSVWTSDHVLVPRTRGVVPSVSLRHPGHQGPAPAPQALRWPSNSSSPHEPAGARSTHPTWPPWSAPGGKFENGKVVERPDESGRDQQAA